MPPKQKLRRLEWRLQDGSQGRRALRNHALNQHRTVVATRETHAVTDEHTWSTQEVNVTTCILVRLRVADGERLRVTSNDSRARLTCIDARCKTCKEAAAVGTSRRHKRQTCSAPSPLDASTRILMQRKKLRQRPKHLGGTPATLCSRVQRGSASDCRIMRSLTDESYLSRRHIGTMCRWNDCTTSWCLKMLRRHPEHDSERALQPRRRDSTIVCRRCCSNNPRLSSDNVQAS